MDRQLYPLCPDFDWGGRDLSVPLRVNFLCYSQIKSKPGSWPRVRQCWTLSIINYRERPGSDPRMMEVGQFLLHKPDELCYVYRPENETIGLYGIYFTGNQAETLLNAFHLEAEKVYTLREDYLERIREICEQMLLEAAQKKVGYQQMLATLLSGLLIQLGRGCRAEEEKRELHAKKRIEKSVMYLHGNYTDSALTVATLAKEIHLSECQYRKLFREAYGMSPVEYITQQRLARACHLLQNTDNSISQIATFCGYQDFSYFSRLFRKKTGMTPSEYRNSIE